MNFIKKHLVKIIIITLSVLTAISIAVTVWAVVFRKSPVLNPDYAAKNPEDDAEQIENGGSSGGTEMPLGGTVTLVYSHEMKIDISEQKAELLIGNLAKSQQNLVVEVIIQGEIVVQSGAIMPGYRVVKLDLAENVSEHLRVGGYEGLIRIYLYDAKTNEREMLSTEIRVQIDVVE